MGSLEFLRGKGAEVAALQLSILPVVLAFGSDRYLGGVVQSFAMAVANTSCADTNHNSDQNFHTMITEKIGKHVIERHDSAGDLPILKYNLFNQFAILESEHGSTPEAIARHFYKIDSLLISGKIDDARQVRQAVNYAFSHILSGNNFPALQWMALVHSVDGNPVTDQSTEKLQAIIATLSGEGLTQRKVLHDVEEAKKKFDAN